MKKKIKRNSAKHHTGQGMSLKAKILVMTIGINLSVGGFNFYQVKRIVSHEKSDIKKGFEHHATSMVDVIGSQFFERYTDVQAMAKEHALKEGKDWELMATALNKHVENFPFYGILLLVDTNGNYLASNTRDENGKLINYAALRGSSYSSTGWFRRAIREEYTSDKEKGLDGTFVEDVHVDSVSTAVYGTRKYGTSFSTLVRNRSGQKIGVLTARADFGWAEQSLKAYYNKLKKGGLSGAVLNILNKRGEVIAEVSAGAKSGVASASRDLDDLLLKLNLAKIGFEPAKKVVANETGSNDFYDSTRDVWEVTGYAPIQTDRFLSEFLGWGIIVRAPVSEVFANVNDIEAEFYWAFSILTILFTVLCWIATNKISDSLVHVSEELKVVSNETYSTAEQLNQSSEEVAAGSTEQAAAVQETVAAMAEMKSMINQTAEHARDCLGLSSQVREQTEDGQRIMQRMVESMEAIQQANSQLQDMVNIINEISSKTAVINDIVFKTQLLSFNASIEAARAGQHGKGFAVVAEEVGNLAHVSGKAATEIQNLLEDSQKSVAQIIESVQGRVSEGQSVSSEAVERFNEISKQVEVMSGRIQNINDATREQESGVSQTSKSMEQMDIATQKNSAIAQQAHQLGDELISLSNNLNRIMMEARQLVLGYRYGENQSKEDKDDTDLRSTGSGGTSGDRNDEINGDSIVSLADKLTRRRKASGAKKAEGFDADDSSFGEINNAS